MAQMGRPKTNNPKNIRFSVNFDKSTEIKVKEYCTKNKISKGEFIRRCVVSYLEAKK